MLDEQNKNQVESSILPPISPPNRNLITAEVIISKTSEDQTKRLVPEVKNSGANTDI